MIFIVVLLIASGCRAKSKEGVLAEVDGYELTVEQFNEEFKMKKNIYIKQFGEDFLNQELEEDLTVEDFLKEELLFEIIHENILTKELEKLNIAITEEDIDKAMKDYYVDGFGGEEEYKKYLDYLGVSDEYLRKSLTRNLLYQKHSEDFLNK